MKHVLTTLALAATSAASFAVIKVVTTTPDLASIAAAVGGANVSASSLIVGARDPHRIEAKPSYMSRVAGADLFIAIGLELEIGYEQPILDGSRNSRVQIGSSGHLYASDWVTVVDKPTGPVSRAMGDIHPYGNPHIWMDPYNGRIVAIKLAAKFESMDSAHAKDYRSNLAAFESRLDSAMFGSRLVSQFGGGKLWDWQRAGVLRQKLGEAGAAGELGGWVAKMLPLYGKPVVTYHKSFNYFANRFGLKVVDELEPKPGLDPTPGHLAEVIKTIGSTGAKEIIEESFYSSKQAQLVAGRTGAKVVIVPQNVGHDPAAKDYVSLFDVIVDRISQGAR
ncbi:MAG: zinc ABC transporter substrate-binding protein [Armatimonadetes bacterium]|nr:zinc ABC transporter substrate-binding protein [Armatimonadota bacterium]